MLTTERYWLTADLFCTHCGQSLEWEDCGQCEDGQIDAYDLDPMWYQPGDTKDCAMCGGKSGWWYCTNRACSGKRDDDAH